MPKWPKNLVSLVSQSYNHPTVPHLQVKCKLMFNIGNVYILHDVAKAQFQETLFDMQEVFRNIGQSFLNMGQ